MWIVSSRLLCSIMPRWDWSVPRRNRKTGRISVFKGRKAKLNHAIFQTLTRKSPQTTWDMFKQLKKQKDMTKLRYWVLIQRVRALQELDYLMKVGETKTMLGTETALYQLTPRAELAITLDQVDLNHFLKKADYHQIFLALEAFQVWQRVQSLFFQRR